MGEMQNRGHAKTPPQSFFWRLVVYVHLVAAVLWCWLMPAGLSTQLSSVGQAIQTRPQAHSPSGSHWPARRSGAVGIRSAIPQEHIETACVLNPSIEKVRIAKFSQCGNDPRVVTWNHAPEVEDNLALVNAGEDMRRPQPKSAREIMRCYSREADPQHGGRQNRSRK